jgi:methylmalonyl-CoA mutase
METEPYHPQHKIRFVTAASLFDGHDASINIIRRILQASGAEVVHLGHNRGADEIVSAAIQEDVQGIAISSYQGGHMEFFRYVRDLLNRRGAGRILVFGGGGGVIVPDEIRELEASGNARIYSPEDGRKLGLQGIVNDMLRRTDFPTVETAEEIDPGLLAAGDHAAIAKSITLIELGACPEVRPKPLGTCAVVGVTGTGGAGKSSLVDELVRRFLHDFCDKRVAILSVDPSRRRTGGALLGDRIRMNSIDTPRVYMRSLATRGSSSELSPAIRGALDVARAAGFDLAIVETSGIGQADAAVVDCCDVSLYVMTSEFGAPSQLEKIEMLDRADLVAINKFERRGSPDALRDVRKQVQRNRGRFDEPADRMPVYGTIASRFNDAGVNVLYRALIDRIDEKLGLRWESGLEITATEPRRQAIVPTDRTQYLGEIAQSVRAYRSFVEEQARIASDLASLETVREMLKGDAEAVEAIDRRIEPLRAEQNPGCRRLLDEWPGIREQYRQDRLATRVRDRDASADLASLTLSGTRIPRVALPRFRNPGDLLRWLMTENLPGRFPFTAGVFPLKRESEDPKRQFAGHGTPDRTNARFHYLSRSDSARRLSTAFDPVTLYGEEPDHRPDIYGRLGESGVSVPTLDDMKRLYAGFDLCDPSTSVSITINGPAPMILAMFLNTAIDQQMERFAREHRREPDEGEREEIRAWTLANVRGTVQADILKEDQGQNECIFSTEFALRMMGDVQQFFIDNGVRNYYSVSISGFHIAEAGANPITQLAFTLANAFTYVEYYLGRGMRIDDFAPSFSFFFSNGMDPEYTVIGRVARRIWATAIRRRYGGGERSQKLKYHVQTSGRSLHAQEIDFNDIRTTLQALLALQDNCNSLHTNAYDEAITTPTEESLRRAMAIQLITSREFGWMRCENALQGSFFVEELTDLVEEAVLQEFERIDERGGVPGAMETQYQRGKIQDESLEYERRKQSGELPIVGVNTFLNPQMLSGQYQPPETALERSTAEEKETQIRRLAEFHRAHAGESRMRIESLKQAALDGGNIFAELMETVRCCSLAQMTHALYEVGGQYRRNI